MTYVLIAVKSRLGSARQPDRINTCSGSDFSRLDASMVVKNHENPMVSRDLIATAGLDILQAITTFHINKFDLVKH